MKKLNIAVLLATAVTIFAQEQKPITLTKDEIIQKDIEEAVKKIASDKVGESQWAKSELLSIGKKAVPALIKALDSDNAQTKFVACSILGELRDTEATTALINKLNDYSEYGESISAAAATALGKLGDDKAIPNLIKLLGSDRIKLDKELRYELIVALGNLRALEAKNEIKKFLDDKNTTFDQKCICFAALDALAKLRANDVTDDIAKLLSDTATKDEHYSGDTLAMRAVKTLGRITGKDLGPIFSADDDKTKDTIKKWQDSFKAEKDAAKVPQEDKVQITYKIMRNVSEKLEKFKAEQGQYPENLTDLVNKPSSAKTWPQDGYAKQEELKDVWNNQLFYHIAGAGGDYILGSCGDPTGKGYKPGEPSIMWRKEYRMYYINKDATEKTMETIAEVLEKFNTDVKHYPQKLQELIDKSYLKEIPKDGWGTDFEYNAPGTGGDQFDLTSYSQDKKKGGTGLDEDFKYKKKNK